MSRPRMRTAPLLALALLAGCQAQEKLGPPPPLGSDDIEGYAYLLKIDVEAGTVQVTPPARPGAGQPGGGLPYSLMGNDIVTVTTTNVVRGPVGSGGPGRRKITFDLALTNRLSVSDLITPTFPLPPAGVQGILAFPYTVAAFGVQGGKATASTDWNGTGAAGSGAPANFFNDFASCSTGATSDCYRWEMFPAPLAPGATTPAQNVGFIVDAGITTVAINLVVAADLLDHPPPPPQPGKGAITGTVSSSLGGAIAGATVTVSPGGATATTDGIGAYAVTGIDVGTVSMTLGNLPANCTAPAPASVAVTSGGIAHADIVVPCLPTYGTVSGLVKILNVQPSAGLTPDPLASTLLQLGPAMGVTDAAGAYQIAGVPSGSYSVTPVNFAGIVGCTLQSPVTITVGSGPVTAPTITLDCSRTITVTVTDAATNAPLPGLAVTVGSFLTTAQGSTDQNGRFVTGSVPTGWYDVGVETASGCTLIGPQSPVLILPVPIQHLDYRLDCPAAFSATITGQFTGQLLVVAPTGFADELTYMGLEVTDPNGQTTLSAAIDPQGNFSIAVPAPGTYVLRGATPLAYAYPMAAALGCTSLNGVSVVVPAGGGTLTAPPITQVCYKGGVVGTVSSTYFSPTTYEVWGIDPAITDPQDPHWILQRTPITAFGPGVGYLIPLAPGVLHELYVVSPTSATEGNCQPLGPQVVAQAGQVSRIDFACTSPVP